MTATHTSTGHGIPADQEMDIVGPAVEQPDAAEHGRPLTLVPRLPTSGPHEAPALPALPGVGPIRGGIELVASAEPAVVFASLGSYAVAGLCDDRVIDIDDGAGHTYRLAYPSAAALVGRGIGSRADAPASQVLRLEFAAPPDTNGGDADDDSRGDQGGSPTHADGQIAALLIEQALRTVAWQRSADNARSAVERAHHLDIALQTSRQIGAAIGILMSTHKITETQAFDLLRAGEPTLATQAARPRPRRDRHRLARPRPRQRSTVTTPLTTPVPGCARVPLPSSKV